MTGIHQTACSDRLRQNCCFFFLLFLLLGGFCGAACAAFLRLDAGNASVAFADVIRSTADRTVIRSAMVGALFSLCFYMGILLSCRRLCLSVLFFARGFLVSYFIYFFVSLGGGKGLIAALALLVFHALVPLPVQIYTASSVFCGRDKRSCAGRMDVLILMNVFSLVCSVCLEIFLVPKLLLYTIPYL